MKSKGIWIAIGCIVIAIGIGAGAAYGMKQKDAKDAIESNNSKPATGNSSDGRTITYNGQQYKYNSDIKTLLFLGVDKTGEAVIQENVGHSGQSDCIIVFALDTKKKTTTMLQISRETMTNIDLYDISGEYLTTQRAQIALQYAYGDGEKKSCWLSKKAVSNLLFQLPIQSCISLNMEGIAAITDAIGGVPVTMAEDYTVIDPAYQAGATVVLNGQQAEHFVRYRDTEVTGSNNQRMERQTQFLNALFQQMKASMATNENAYASIISSASPYMTSDMSADDMKKLSEYDMADIVEKVPGQVQEGAEHDEFVVNNVELQEMLINMFYK